ncbi:MAG: LysR family transcriptional regulator [Lachnospiraceae bacterium]
MNTTQLECFLAVAKYLNFSKASDSVQITQPAVSRQINSLEEELGIKLFMRTSKKVELTISGIQFIEDAKEIIRIANTAKERYRTDSGQAAHLYFEICCHDQFEQAIIPPILNSFLAKHPTVHPDVKTAPPTIMETRLTEQKADVLFGFEHIHPHGETILYHELTTCPIACICAKNHRLAKHTELLTEELDGSFIICDPNMASYDSFQLQNRVITDPASEIYHTNGINTALTLVKSGVGFTLYPDISYSREYDLAYIPVTDLPAVSFGIFTSNEKNKPLVRDFIQLARDLF